MAYSGITRIDGPDDDYVHSVGRFVDETLYSAFRLGAELIHSDDLPVKSYGFREIPFERVLDQAQPFVTEDFS